MRLDSDEEGHIFDCPSAQHNPLPTDMAKRRREGVGSVQGLAVRDIEVLHPAMFAVPAHIHLYLSVADPANMYTPQPLRQAHHCEYVCVDEEGVTERLCAMVRAYSSGGIALQIVLYSYESVVITYIVMLCVLALCVPAWTATTELSGDVEEALGCTSADVAAAWRLRKRSL